MTQSKIRFILLTISMLLMFTAMSMTGIINMTTFKQSYNESLVSNYRVLGEQTVRKIEYAVRYGKPITNFYGIEELLSENIHLMDGFEEVQVVLPGGDIIYNQHGVVEGRQVVDQVKEQVRFFDSRTESEAIFVFDDDYYYIYSPIYDSNDTWIASLGHVLNEEIVTSDLNQYQYQIIYYFLLFSLATFLLLIVFLYKIQVVSVEGKLLKRKIMTIVLTILGVAQMTFGFINYTSLKDGYLDLVTENTSLALNVIRTDIEEVVKKGVPYTDLNGVGEYMNEMIQFLPEVERISILNADLSTEGMNNELFHTKFSYSVPLVTDSQGESYISVVDLSENFINSKTEGILLDTITMVVLSFLLIVEMILFVLLYIEKKVHSVHRVVVANESIDEDRMFVRPLAFLIFCAVFLSGAYVPLLMKEIYEPFFRLPFEVVLGLPLALEIFIVIITFFLVRFTTGQVNWRMLCVTGLLILALSSFASALSWNPMTFLVSRSVAGFGFGLTLLALYQYCYHSTSEKQNRETFSQFQFGSVTGMYFGLVMGAVLAEQVGLFQVYFVAIPLFFVAISFALKFMPNLAQKRFLVRRYYFGTKQYRRKFLMNAQVGLTFLLVVIPVAAATMFLFYVIPLFGDAQGVTISDMGRIFLIQGLLMIYFQPIYTKHISTFVTDRNALLLSAFFVLVGFFFFFINNSIVTATLTVFFLSLGYCISVYAQRKRLFENNPSMALTEGNINSYYYFGEYVGKLVGITSFVFLLYLFGYSGSALIIGGTVFFLTIVFLLLTKRAKSRELIEMSVEEGLKREVN